MSETVAGGRASVQPGSAVPSVTIGLPVYNGEPFLEDTLRSLLRQDHPNLEIVISDNGSTDATEAICRGVAEQDHRVRYHRSATNQGASWNYNQVLHLADGELFKWAAADDLCEPSFIAACVSALADGPAGAVVAFPATVLIDADGHPMGPMDDRNLDLRQERAAERLRGLLTNRFEWHPVFGVIKTSALRRTRGIGPFLLADVTLLAELCMMGEFLRVPEDLFLRRYHEGRSVVANATWQEQLAWYTPGRTSRAVLPQARLIRELLSAVARADLPPMQRWSCARVVTTAWALPHWRHVGGELKRALPQLWRREPQRGSGSKT
jgi:glycosyltransferase involved in cell wall biosynthesis